MSLLYQKTKNRKFYGWIFSDKLTRNRKFDQLSEVFIETNKTIFKQSNIGEIVEVWRQYNNLRFISYKCQNLKFKGILTFYKQGFGTLVLFVLNR